MSVHVAILALVRPTVQNVLNVLYYQIDGHCRGIRAGQTDAPARLHHVTGKLSNVHLLAHLNPNLI